MTTVSPSHVQLTFKEKQQRFSTPKKENFKNIIEAGRFTNAQNYLEGVNRVPKYFLNLVDPILSNLRKKGNIKRIENINKIENTIRKIIVWKYNSKCYRIKRKKSKSRRRQT